MPMTDLEADVRLAVYRDLADMGEVGTPASLADRFGVTPFEIAETFRALASEHDALVMLPDSPYIWMAEPFSAVPTDYPVIGSDGRRWWGNCIWDALSVATLVDTNATIATRCPASGAELTLEVAGDELRGAGAVVHLAIRPSDWWRSIGFT